VRKKTEEELVQSWGKEIGKVLFEEAYCEDRFPTVNLISSQKMEPLDSEEFDARQRFEARTNAYQIRSNILKLVRLF